MNSSNKKKINHQSHIFKKKLGITVIFNALIFKLFRIFTKESLPIFLRGGDIISINPQIKSSHEPELTILVLKTKESFEFEKFPAMFLLVIFVRSRF